MTQEYFEPNQSVLLDIEKNTPKFTDEKKTVKVDIDIPLNDTTHPNKEADCEDNLLNDKRDNVEEDNVELYSCDNDDVQSVQSVKSNDSLRYKLVLTLIGLLHWLITDFQHSCGPISFYYQYSNYLILTGRNEENNWQANKCKQIVWWDMNSVV